MKSFITCRRGLEEFAINELIDFGVSDSEKKDGYILFEPKDDELLVRFLYKSGMIIRGGMVLFESSIGKTLQESKKILEPLIRNISYDGFFNRSATFRVECLREGEHEFKSNEAERLIGGMLFDELEKKGLEPKVDLKNPEVNIFAQIIDDNIMIGVDLVGFDSNKRDYKLFSNSHSIKGDLARAMVLLGTENIKKGIILDPFCSDGVVGIEFALYVSNKSHNHYRKRDFLFKKSILLKEVDINSILKKEDDKEIENIKFNINCFDSLFHNLKSTQKNAKIAGVDKRLNISRVEPDIADLKFEEKSVSAIITVLPSRSKHVDFGKMKKQVEDFFEQAKNIIDKDGKVVILTGIEDYINIIKSKGFSIDRIVDIGINKRKIYSLS